VAQTVGNPRAGVVLQEEPPWANSTERQFASLLDSYGIAWEHEPHRFPIAFDDEGHPSEFFTPDFYLPETDEYIEMTVLKQDLCTRKNRKLRLLRDLYPDVRCRIIYRRDYESLALKYGWDANPDFPGLGVPQRPPGPPRIRVDDR
jgi:hypoxanthine phosphoribosyltransferase